MVYLEKIMQFLVAYDVIILPCLFAAVWVFGAANWCKNVYRRQNKKLRLCCSNVLMNPKYTGVYMAMLPEEYRRQWRAYVNSKAERPSLVFEFVPRKNKVIFLHLFVACALVSCVYFAIFVLDVSHKHYAVFQAAYWLAFVVVMLVNKFLFAKKEKRARQLFGKLVAQLNATRDISEKESNEHLVKSLNNLKKESAADFALEKASALLRQSGLENTRTPQQQRQINAALNGLLQAYSRNAAHSKA